MGSYKSRAGPNKRHTQCNFYASNNALIMSWKSDRVLRKCLAWEKWGSCADYQNCRSRASWRRTWGHNSHNTPFIHSIGAHEKLNNSTDSTHFVDIFSFSLPPSVRSSVIKVESSFFSDRWRDDGSTIATMFNQNFQWTAHNSQKSARQKSHFSLTSFTSKVRSALSWSHCIIPVIFVRWLPSEIFFLPLRAHSLADSIVSWSSKPNKSNYERWKWFDKI